MGGSWNYRRLRQLHHKFKNVQEWKVTLNEERRQKMLGKFPNCRGRFDDCPPEEEDPVKFVKDGKLITPEKDLPAECRICPVYHEWKKI